MSENKSELERIKEVYAQRKERIPSQLYSCFNPANLFIIQTREWEIIHALKRYGITNLDDKKVLDVGCGSGGELRNLIRYGVKPENLFGIDLLTDRIEMAKRISPNIGFSCSSAKNIPFENDFFDIVMQFTVFTSILDSQMKKHIATEMLRVLKPDGIILWYDYHMNNPNNPDVRGVKRKEIYELFPKCDISLKRITLAPPITRLLAPYSWLACYLLEKLNIFNTHYVGIVKRVKC